MSKRFGLAIWTGRTFVASSRLFDALAIPRCANSDNQAWFKSKGERHKRGRRRLFRMRRSCESEGIQADVVQRRQGIASEHDSWNFSSRRTVPGLAKRD